MLLIFVKGMDRFHLLTDNKWAVRALMTPAFQELYKHIYIRLLNVVVNSLSSIKLKMSTICQLQFSEFMERMNYLCRNNLLIYEKENNIESKIHHLV